MPVLRVAVFSNSVAAEEKIRIAAANSTCVSIKNAGAIFAKDNDAAFEYVCKSSGRLAKGLMGGAIEADYYISANKQWMDRMVEAERIDRDAVKSLWGNRLVVAAPIGASVSLDAWEDLGGSDIKTILIGDPSTAPFGRYAKQAMQKSGIWDAVRTKIETKKHITLLAETLGEREKGTVGVLFATNLTDRLAKLLEAPGDLHPAIRYYSAPLKGKQTKPAVAAFMAFLETEPALAAFENEGFKVGK